MDDLYRSYLALLEAIGEKLDQLSALARKKIHAVRTDDLNELNEVMKQEQAIALSFRGMEQKRVKMMQDMGIAGTSLAELAAYFPAELQLEARHAAEKLKNQFRIYQNDGNLARDLLECNLHEIEKTLERLGKPQQSGTGYGIAEAQPPAAMRTDFRA